MRINIAFFDKDTVYINRLLKSFREKYVKQTSVSVFTDEKIFAAELLSQHFDIAVIDQDYMNLRSIVPEKTILAVFVKDNAIDEIESIPAVGKYQRFENIYKRIVDVYADHSVGIKVRRNSGKSSIIMFTSVQGGCGTSSLAAAYAINRARNGKYVFYLNLETFGSANSFFSGEGKGSFSDIIYALKSKNVNFVLKLEAVTRKDESGVEFINGCRNAFDMMELKDSEITDLIEGIEAAQEYDLMVIDYSGALSPRQLKLMKEHADTIIYVSDGSETGNEKFSKFCEAVRVIEKKENTTLLNKMALVYNRYSSKTSRQMETLPITLLGGIHRIEGVTGRDLVEELSKQDVIPNI